MAFSGRKLGLLAAIGLPFVALLLLAISLPTVGCTEATSSASAQSIAASNFIATARAKMTLRAFFRAWAGKDGAAVEALLTESRRQHSNYADWWFETLDHVEFGTVVAVPEGIDSYVTYGRGSRDHIAREDVRCFRASVTSYFKPGFVGTNDSGEELPWLWWLVRGPDGRWGVDSWGA